MSRTYLFREHIAGSNDNSTVLCGRDFAAKLNRHQILAALALVLSNILGASAQTNPSAIVPLQLFIRSAPVATAKTFAFDANQKAPKYFEYQPSTQEGWVLLATAGGRSADLSNWSGWRSDTNVWPGQVQVGVGWRAEGVSAIVGYTSAKRIRSDYGAAQFKTRANLFGMNLTVSVP